MKSLLVTSFPVLTASPRLLPSGQGLRPSPAVSMLTLAVWQTPSCDIYWLSSPFPHSFHSSSAYITHIYPSHCLLGSLQNDNIRHCHTYNTCPPLSTPVPPQHCRSNYSSGCLPMHHFPPEPSHGSVPNPVLTSIRSVRSPATAEAYIGARLVSNLAIGCPSDRTSPMRSILSKRASRSATKSRSLASLLILLFANIS